MTLAVWLGRFIGAVLAECGPVLAEILSHAIREGFSNSVEDGAVRDDLRERLLKRVRSYRVNSPGRTGTAPGNDSPGESLGGGQDGQGS